MEYCKWKIIMVKLEKLEIVYLVVDYVKTRHIPAMFLFFDIIILLSLFEEYNNLNYLEVSIYEKTISIR